MKPAKLTNALGITLGALVMSSSVMAANPMAIEFDQPLATAQFTPGQTTIDLTVGFGSGAFHYAKDPADVFYTITDRGPNIKCSDSKKLLGVKDFCGTGMGANKIFPAPDYAPKIVKFQLKNGTVSILEEITIKNNNKASVTGITNQLVNAKTEQSFSNQARLLPFNNDGLDTEALVKLSDGSFWLADEYAPSLVRVDATGQVIERVVPESIAADLASANYPVQGLLPDVYKHRKLNRGIESIAVSPDEKFLYFIMQSPLAFPNGDAYKNSRNVRLMKLALNNGSIEKLVGEFVYVLDTPQTFADLASKKGDLKGGKIRKQSDVKVSEMVAIDTDQLIVLERISKTTKLYRIDLSSGQNILNSEIASGKVQTKESDKPKTLEQIWDLHSVNANPVYKQLVFNSLTDTPEGISLPKKVEGIALLDEKRVLLVNDNDFGIDGLATQFVVLPIYEQLAQPATSKPNLQLVGRYTTGVFDEGAAEIVAYHSKSQQIFVVNSNDKTVDVLATNHLAAQPLENQFSANNLKKVGSIDVKSAVTDRKLGAANSVAVSGDLVAVAIEAADKLGNKKQGRGIVAFYNANTLAKVKAVEVGFLPDMVTFTPDGTKVLVANEGEPNKQYTVDPIGSISIIAITQGVPADKAMELTFDGVPTVGDVRVFGPTQNLSQNLEPEYIAVSADSRSAWVSLQENNAFALLDLERSVITKVVSLGLKDYGLPGNELDVSDKDKATSLTTRPGVYGMYQPDSIAAFEHRGHHFVVSANEGDARDYWFDAANEADCLAAGGLEFDEEDGCLAYSEETRIAKLKLASNHPSVEQAADKKSLGRMKTTLATGDTDQDGKVDQIHTYGARSFSIWNAEGQLVFDSLGEIEKVTLGRLGKHFNNTDNKNKGDNRSDDKGAEPEAITVGQVNGRTLAFVGLERTGGIIVYDITSPYGPQFLQYLNNRNFDVDVKENLNAAGDLAPEGMKFVPASESAIGAALLIVGNEVSGSTSVYSIM